MDGSTQEQTRRDGALLPVDLFETQRKLLSAMHLPPAHIAAQQRRLYRTVLERAAQVQAELESASSPRERRSLQEELSLMRRGLVCYREPPVRCPAPAGEREGTVEAIARFEETFERLRGDPSKEAVLRVCYRPLPAVEGVELLPLGLPPMLLGAFGLDQPIGRWAAFYLSRERVAVIRQDACGALANGHESALMAWLTFVEHPLMRSLLSPYELGGEEDEATHWLLVDHREETLSVALPAAAMPLLRGEPSKANLFARGRHAEDAIEDARAAIRRSLSERGDGAPADPDRTTRGPRPGLEQQLAREQQLIAWLDERARSVV